MDPRKRICVYCRQNPLQGWSPVTVTATPSHLMSIWGLFLFREKRSLMETDCWRLFSQFSFHINYYLAAAFLSGLLILQAVGWLARSTSGRSWGARSLLMRKISMRWSGVRRTCQREKYSCYSQLILFVFHMEKDIFQYAKCHCLHKCFSIFHNTFSRILQSSASISLLTPNEFKADATK